MLNETSGASSAPLAPDDVWAIIPTLNERETLPRVVEQTLPYVARILIVDGASTDGTREWVEEQIAKGVSLQLEVVTVRGKGRALRRALKLVPVRWTVMLDADGSHVPSDIPRFLEPLRQGEADMVVGSRWTGGSDELHGDMNMWLRRMGSQVLTRLVNLRWGADLSDIQNGYRALSTHIGRRIGLASPDFNIEQEMVMKFLAGGYRVTNVPSHEYARQGGVAKLDLGQVWFRFGVVVLRHLFGLSRPKLRRRPRRNRAKRRSETI
ncbi:undecaprenyl-phosphate mannosyltransferase [Abditibacteriota bacterium]|nr:undecaprenyl-phosphate mannosyltransferase [Abditibacteriota bacterium]